MKLVEGEHFVAQRRDEQQIHLRKDAGHFLSHAASKTVGLDEVDSGKEAGLAEKVGPRVGNLHLSL